MKAQADDEIKAARQAIHLLGGDKAESRTFTLPGTDMTRTIVTVQKTRKTPSLYPRKAGKVEQNPLK